MNDSDLLKFLFQYAKFYSGPVNFFVEVKFENMLLKRMIRILNRSNHPYLSFTLEFPKLGHEPISQLQKEIQSLKDSNPLLALAVSTSVGINP